MSDHIASSEKLNAAISAAPLGETAGNGGWDGGTGSHPLARRQQPTARRPQPPAPEDTGLLRFLTCGSVDDGKSTLIGRLLFDSKAILADALQALQRSSKLRGLETIDLSLLTDGLQAEREQGITIDVAYRYFSSGRRKYILADAPGHEQYTRNMVTAASTADLAIILIDARKGVLTQTRRHSALANLLGIRHLVVAVNKMDLVDWSEHRFEEIKREYLAFAAKLGIRDLRFIPISALKGDQLVERKGNLGWYKGPTLFEILESIQLEGEAEDAPFRFPVQLVSRPRSAEYSDYRAYLGRIESGSIAVGDEIIVLPAGTRSRIAAILLGNECLSQARQGQSVALQLADELDISRGDLIAKVLDTLKPAKELSATLAWLSETPHTPGRTYLLRHGTRETRAHISSIHSCLDMESLTLHPTGGLAMNDIAEATLKVQHPLAVDAYEEVRTTGSFILIDATTNATVAAGLIRRTTLQTKA